MRWHCYVTHYNTHTPFLLSEICQTDCCLLQIHLISIRLLPPQYSLTNAESWPKTAIIHFVVWCRRPPSSRSVSLPARSPVPRPGRTCRWFSSPWWARSSSPACSVAALQNGCQRRSKTSRERLELHAEKQETQTRSFIMIDTFG